MRIFNLKNNLQKLIGDGFEGRWEYLPVENLVKLLTYLERFVMKEDNGRIEILEELDRLKQQLNSSQDKE